MSLDPVITNSAHYRVIFENDQVRVLEYTDQPGDITTPHAHPGSVMYTLSSFRRRLVSGEMQREVEMESGVAGWLPAQQHHGENIGETPTHVIFVELKGVDTGSPSDPTTAEIGPR
jgi:quercetin dioxygenase-like cupin family protein